MTSLKKFAVIGIAVLAIGATSITAFAASSNNSPADIAAGLTGKSVEDVIVEKTETGKSYGTIANDAGKLEDFKNDMLATKKEILEQKVKDGTLTQQEADEILAAIEANQVNCDGTGNAGIGKGMGAGFGRMMGNGQGQGKCQGLGNGSCLGNSSNQITN